MAIRHALVTFRFPTPLIRGLAIHAVSSRKRTDSTRHDSTRPREVQQQPAGGNNEAHGISVACFLLGMLIGASALRYADGVVWKTKFPKARELQKRIKHLESCLVSAETTKKEAEKKVVEMAEGLGKQILDVNAQIMERKLLAKLLCDFVWGTELQGYELVSDDTLIRNFPPNMPHGRKLLPQQLRVFRLLDEEGKVRALLLYSTLAASNNAEGEAELRALHSWLDEAITAIHSAEQTSSHGFMGLLTTPRFTMLGSRSVHEWPADTYKKDVEAVKTPLDRGPKKSQVQSLPKEVLRTSEQVRSAYVKATPYPHDRNARAIEVCIDTGAGRTIVHKSFLLGSC